MPRTKIRLISRENVKGYIRAKDKTELQKRLFQWESIYNYLYISHGAVYCAWCMRMILTLPSKEGLAKPILDKLLNHMCYNGDYDIPEERYE